MNFSLRLLLLPLAAFALTSAAADETDDGVFVAATTAVGPITQAEIRIQGTISGSAYPDPVRTARTARSEAERNDARSFVQDLSEWIIWHRHWSAQANEAGFQTWQEYAEAADLAGDMCLARVYLSRQLEGLTTVTLESAAGLIERHSQRFYQPEGRNVSYLFRACATTASAEVKEQIRVSLEDARGAVESGKLKFRDAARRYSEGPGAARGGHVGLVTRDSTYNPRFIELVFATAEGTLSPVTELHNGFYVVQVDSVQPEVRITPEFAWNHKEGSLQLLAAARDDLQKELAAAAASEHPEEPNPVAQMAAYAHARGFTSDECTTAEQMTREALRAREYFEHANRASLMATEADYEEYFEKNPGEFLDQRIWKLTEYVVPVSSKPGAPVVTRADAMRIAEHVRTRALAGETTTALAEELATSGVVIRETADWLHHTVDGEVDKDLLQLKPGEFTRVHDTSLGAMFCRLDAVREPVQLTIDDRRDYVENNTRLQKVIRAMEADRKRLGEELEVRLTF